MAFIYCEGKDTELTNLELSLLMGIWPIIYFLIYTHMTPVKRIKTTALGRTGQLVESGQTHSLIEFDNGLRELCRNSYFEEFDPYASFEGYLQEIVQHQGLKQACQIHFSEAQLNRKDNSEGDPVVVNFRNL